MRLVCGGIEEDEEGEESKAVPQIECPDAGVPTYQELATGAPSKCILCHDSAKWGRGSAGAADINSDTYGAAVADATEAVLELGEGAMPPASAHRSPRPRSRPSISGPCAGRLEPREGLRLRKRNPRARTTDGADRGSGLPSPGGRRAGVSNGAPA